MAQWIARQTSDLKVQGSSPCVDSLFFFCHFRRLSLYFSLLPSVML